MTTGLDIRAALSALFLLTGGTLAAAGADGPPGNAPDGRVARILDGWQLRSAALVSLDVRFTGVSRNDGQAGGPFTGRVALAPGGRALVEFVSPARGNVAAGTVRFLWSGDALHRLRVERKEHAVWPVAEEDRGKLPAALALPFLWRVDADGLRSRYRVALVKEEARVWTLSFAPLPGAVRPSFSKAFLQLDRETYLPLRYFVIGVGGKSTTDYRATEALRDRPIPEDVFQVPEGEGWELIGVDQGGIASWLSGLFKQDLLP